MQKLIISIAALIISINLNAADGKQNQLTNNKSWTADNGNGTFTNPLFYDEDESDDEEKLREILSEIIPEYERKLKDALKK